MMRTWVELRETKIMGYFQTWDVSRTKMLLESRVLRYPFVDGRGVFFFILIFIC